MQSIVLLALVVCAVAQQNYNYNGAQQQPGQQTTRFNQYNSGYNQPSYNTQPTYNSQYGQYSSTPNYGNAGFPGTQRYYNGISMTSALTALTAAAVAYVL